MPDTHETHAHAAQQAPGQTCQCEQQLGDTLLLLLIALVAVTALDRWSRWRKRRNRRKREGSADGESENG